MSAIIIVMTGAREAGEAVGLGTNGRGAKGSGEEKFGDGDGQGEKLEEEALAGMGKGRRARQRPPWEGVRQVGTSRRAPSDSGPSRQAQRGIDDGNEVRVNWATSCSTVGKRAEQSRAEQQERRLLTWFSERRTERLGPQRYMLQVQTHSLLGFWYRIDAELGAASQSLIPRRRLPGCTDRYHPGGWLAQGTITKQRPQYLHLRDSYSVRHGRVPDTQVELTPGTCQI
jgi:hypothetical protein